MEYPVRIFISKIRCFTDQEEGKMKQAMLIFVTSPEFYKSETFIIILRYFAE